MVQSSDSQQISSPLHEANNDASLDALESGSSTALELCPTCGRKYPDHPTLSPRRQRFVAEYMVDLNATQAAIRAGYAPGGAKVTGSRLLSNANVAAAIEDARGILTRRTGLAAEWAIRKLAANGIAAMDKGAYGPANRAFELVGQHFGAFPAPKAPTPQS